MRDIALGDVERILERIAAADRAHTYEAFYSATENGLCIRIRRPPTRDPADPPELRDMECRYVSHSLPHRTDLIDLEYCVRRHVDIALREIRKQDESVTTGCVT